jgi:predicted NBD/HSP70 family sugar kinase
MSFQSIGICFPGLVDYNSQRLINIPTAPSIRPISVNELSFVLEIEGHRIIIDNDCTAAGYGELRLGNLKGSENSILFSIGTGIGLGINLNGSVYRGARGLAGEVGHSLYAPSLKKCRCGRIGCYETMLPDFQSIFQMDDDCLHLDFAQLFLKAAGSLLGMIINMLNVDRVGLYGHTFKNHHLRAALIEHVGKYTMSDQFSDCSFVDCMLGRWAGAEGIALMALMRE